METAGLGGATASHYDIFGMMVGLGWGTSKPLSVVSEAELGSFALNLNFPLIAPSPWAHSLPPVSHSFMLCRMESGLP